MINLSKRTVSYQNGHKTTLNIDTLSFQQGEKVCLLGRSGSGKTTLLECLFRLRPFTGEINIDVQHIAFSPQSSDLIDTFTVKTNVLMGQFQKGLLKNLISLYQKQPKLDELLTELGIRHLRDEYVQTLSGGEKQRVLIARSITENKPLTLFDEPTSALDVYHSQKTMSTLMTQLKDSTIICAIHDLSLVDYFDRVIVLSEGKIILDTPANQVDRQSLKEYFD